MARNYVYVLLITGHLEEELSQSDENQAGGGSDHLQQEGGTFLFTEYLNDL